MSFNVRTVSPGVNASLVAPGMVQLVATESSRFQLVRTGAYLSALTGVIQLLLGGYLISSPGGLNSVHNVAGLLAIVATAFTAYAAFRWKNEGGNPGLFFHAAGMAVIAIVQYGLGEVGGARTIHIILGILYVVGVIALATLVNRKPVAA